MVIIELDWHLYFDKAEEPIPRWRWVAQTPSGMATIIDYRGGYLVRLAELEQTSFRDIHSAVNWVQAQLDKEQLAMENTRSVAGQFPQVLAVSKSVPFSGNIQNPSDPAYYS